MRSELYLCSQPSSWPTLELWPLLVVVLVLVLVVEVEQVLWLLLGPYRLSRVFDC